VNARLEWTQARPSFWVVVDDERVAEITHDAMVSDPVGVISELLAVLSKYTEKEKVAA
jgi:hypothetical protein